ncbi:hypothetical protein CTZ28_09170 [Streptomyces shenzhenensis]|uniref:Uncharacterized protein n=1 Tax=Streptomyces shenzhenensis TaxID=943815 RepID=A0A3M0IHQ7_9ACTN|nr:hypothetical protein CTZ28_09170 [Streptomyces shenzhenensis]
MSSTSTHQPCDHPVRDVAIVVLIATVACLVAAVIVMSLNGGPLETVTGSGTTFLAVFAAGMTVLSHVRRA